MLEVRLLGQFDVRADGKRVVIPSRAGQSLLAFLVLTTGTAHRREKLAGQFWPETTDENARGNLRRELWRVRKALTSQQSTPSDYLLAEELTISFNPQADYWLDVAQLERPIAGDHCVADLISQLSFYRGELLPGFYDDWVMLEREHIQTIFEQKMTQLLEQLVAEERWAMVLEWGEQWIALGQTPEPAYRALILAYGARGDMAKVAALYQRCREALRDNLGVEPSAETQALYEGLLKGSQIPQRAATTQPPSRAMFLFNDNEPAAPGVAPFKGLAYFDVADVNWFYGREALATKLITRLRDAQFLSVIVGASGSGKSSLVRAGMIPALHGDASLRRDIESNVPTYTHIHVITPTAHPLEALATSLTRGSESVTATATLIDDLARDPRALHLFVRKMLTLTPSPLSLIGRGGGGEGSRLLLVVDQFEELFTLCHDEFEREAFIDNLLHAIGQSTTQVEANSSFILHPSHLTLILTLRADFYAYLAQYPELREAVAQHQEYIGPMSAEELRRAIEEPAKRGDWEFEPGLVDLILRDVGDEPGALPLLSHALLETWQRRAGHRLTLKGYHEAGGVHGAIAHTAESVYQALSPEQQTIARNIFLRLTELGEGTEDTRRRVSIDELLTHNTGAEIASHSEVGSALAMTLSQNTNEQVRAVLNGLAEARLITLGQGTAEVAHEALIREWPTLREWLNQDREGLRLHRHLTEAAQEWALLEREAGALYRGARLVQAREWAALHPNVLNVQERAFLEASNEQEQREAQDREAQQRRELEAARKLAEEQRERAEEQTRASARMRQRALYLVGALLLAMVMMVTASGFAYQANQNEQRANENAQRAENERRVAFVRELSVNAVSNLDVDPERSILLALQAVSVSSANGKPVLREAEEALHRAVQISRVQLTLRGHTAALEGIAYSPDASRIATASDDKTAKVWDAVTGKELLTLIGHTDSIQNVAFSPDGKHLATTSFDKTAKIWDVVTGKALLTLSGHTNALWGVAFSPDGTRLATSSVDKTAKVWDVATGKELLTLSGHSDLIRRVTFSPDGMRLATGSNDKTAKVWDAITGKELLTLPGHTQGIWSMAFSPDGTRLATGGAAGDATLKLWDAASGRQLSSVLTIGSVNAAAFNSTGTRLVTGHADGAAKVWDVASVQLVLELRGHNAGILGVVLSPDGTRIATASTDSTAKVWNILPAGGREWHSLPVPSGRVRDIAYSLDGTRLVTGGAAKTAQVWDATTGKEVLTLTGHTDEIRGVAISPDNRHIATISDDRTVKVWDATTGQVLFSLSTQADSLGFTDHSVTFSPDGRRLAVEGAGFTAQILNATTGQVLLTLSGHMAPIRDVAFSPDGKRLATASDDRTAKVWDADNGKELFILSSHTGRIYGVVFSRDGTHLATASNDGTAKVWDAVTGKELFTLTGHNGIVFNADFSPDGTRLATSSSDATVKVWNVSSTVGRSEQPLTLYSNASSTSYSVIFSPDGKRLATAGNDGTARVWALPIEDIVAIAKTRVTRTLTTDECQKYLHVEQCPPN